MRPSTGVVLAALSATTRAAADVEPDSGLEAGGRIGYAVPFGGLTDDPGGDLDQSIRGMVPLWLDLGYRIVPEWMVGAWLQTGFGFMGDDFVARCDAAGLDCRVFDLRLGVQVQYHVRPAERVDPWVGLGFGYEWLTFSSNDGADDTTLTYRGWELVNVQAGVDVLPRKGVGVGPFASFSLGRYDATAAVTPVDDETDDIARTRFHQWLVVGVRGTFVL